ncbi:hypothetical protein [Novosphingobium sp.]|uniref:hypothetical protein n=1 Tax=Novosphingobium sp. TaxID=1874826 RepID=UPI003D6C9A0E
MVQSINVAEADPRWIASSLAHLIKNLRDQDRAEMEAMHGLPPELVLPQALIVSSHCWIAVEGGEPFAIYGAAPTALPGVGSIWFLGTDGVTRYGRSVARRTVPMIQKMHETYPVLWNHIDTRNTVSMRWLRWSGFKLLGDHTAPSGHLFHLFARSVDHV